MAKKNKEIIYINFKNLDSQAILDFKKKIDSIFAAARKYKKDELAWKEAAAKLGEDIVLWEFNPEIPFPVEIEKGADVFESITVEAILSAMMQLLTQDPWRKNRNYYRNFIRICKPHLLKELCRAAAVKAENGDFDLSCEIAGVLKGVFPKSARALHARAAIFDDAADGLRRMGRDEDARKAEAQTEEAYKDALSLKEPLTDTLYNAGFFYHRIQDYVKALAYLKEYIPLSENAIKKVEAERAVSEIEKTGLDDALFSEARNLIEEGREEAGMENLKIFMRKNPTVWNAWFMLGWALRRLKRWRDAEAVFLKTIELGGDNPDVRNELAICLIEMDRLDEARTELEKALANDFENVKILSNLAILEAKCGDNEKAAAFFRIVLEYSPQDPIALEFCKDQ
ncbi:MAG: tetratricopeptide repeat protein [Spirochaetaceae bacterium]|jgi:tetratricopeptide (TPR) repeat protein|nr:tetratricopeptide repeat protein [Spirochaetaceae bacterium]